MMIFKHELKENYKMLLIWSLIIGALTITFMTMYKSLEPDIAGIADTYANMGSFSSAFGMDKIEFTTALGFYGIEAGAMLSICGSMFGAMTGISVLSKEEYGHTAEFLLTHPVSRKRVALEKLFYVWMQVILFNMICLGAAVVSFGIIGEKIEFKPLLLFHAAQLVMHLEIACICYAVSAFCKRLNTGIGLGFAAVLYFVSIMYNITEDAEKLKYITPFVYADAGTVISEEAIDMGLMGIGIGVMAVCMILGIFWYDRKDMAA